MAISVDLTLTNLVILGVIWFAVKKLISLFNKWKLEKTLAKWDNSPKDKVILHTLWRCRTIPSISPYGLKLETYLRMAKIPYELDTKDTKGPKGKLPWISYNGTHMGDSHLIIKFLNKKLSVDLNKKATEDQIATARAIRIMLEEHYVWGTFHNRAVENLSNLPQIVKIPTFMKLLLPLGSGSVKSKLVAVGMGVHTATEINEMTEDDLHTASKLLGKKKFFGGDEPCEEDSSIFASVAQAVWALPGSGFERLVHGELSNLKEYCERMKHLYWPDWEECLDK